MEQNPSLAAGQPSQGSDWTHLIHQVAEGDQQALGLLYDETSSLVYSLAMRIVGNAATAEEVTLDVYTQIWRQAKSFDGRRGNPSAWLLVLTRSRSIDRLRSGAQERQRRTYQDTDYQVDPNASPEESSVVTEQRHLVQTAMATLPSEQRQVIELAYFSGLSHSHIAERLRLPAGTVKTRIRLGMAKLRDSLKPLMD